MRVISSEIRSIRKTGVDFKISNGIRQFAVSVDKDNITFDDIKNYNVHVKVYVLAANCCKTIPMTIIESGKSPEDEKDIKEILEALIKNHEDELTLKL